MTAPEHNHFHRGPLARRLILWTIAFSGALALLITAAQLFVEYRRDVGIVEERFALIEHGYLDSIVDTVWVADRQHLETLLDGIVRLPDFAYAEVAVDGKPFAARGSATAADAGVITRRWPLTRQYRNQEMAIGELIIRADLATARQRFVERAVFIIAANTIKTILVAFFMLLLFDRLVARHLAKLVHDIARSSPDKLDPLALDRPKRDDELDQLVGTLNHLRGAVDSHNAEIRALNAQLEQRVVERTAELERANKELESFAYSVSHDLQAPLWAITGFSRILMDDERPRLSAPGRDMLDRVVRNTDRMSELIENILDYSRAGRRPIERSRVEIEPLVRSVVESFSPDYPQARVSIGELPEVVGDPTMIEQIMQNLIGNAFKYSSKKGQAEIEIGARTENKRTVYFVRDNGTGFDMHYADKLFGMFQRLHTEREFPGTGVGLAIVKRLIERHGGEIWVQAEPDRGAEFMFTLGTPRG